MKRRTRYCAPDTRLDWRDPNMPVLRYGKINGVEGTHLVKSTSITEYYHYKMLDRFYNPPNWKDDPSYWWSKRRK